MHPAFWNRPFCWRQQNGERIHTYDLWTMVERKRQAFPRVEVQESNWERIPSWYRTDPRESRSLWIPEKKSCLAEIRKRLLAMVHIPLRKATIPLGCGFWRCDEPDCIRGWLAYLRRARDATFVVQILAENGQKAKNQAITTVGNQTISLSLKHIFQCSELQHLHRRNTQNGNLHRGRVWWRRMHLKKRHTNDNHRSYSGAWIGSTKKQPTWISYKSNMDMRMRCKAYSLHTYSWMALDWHGMGALPRLPNRTRSDASWEIE